MLRRFRHRRLLVHQFKPQEDSDERVIDHYVRDLANGFLCKFCDIKREDGGGGSGIEQLVLFIARMEIAADAKPEYDVIQDADQAQPDPAGFESFSQVAAIRRKAGKIMPAVEAKARSAGSAKPSPNGVLVNIWLDESTVDVTHLVRFILAAHEAGAETDDGGVHIRTIEKKKKDEGGYHREHARGFFVQRQHDEHRDSSSHPHVVRARAGIAHAQAHQQDAAEE